MRSFPLTKFGLKQSLRVISAFALMATTLAWFTAPAAQGQELAVVSIGDVSVTEINGTPGVAYKNVLVTFSVTGARNGSVTVTYDTFDTGSATADLDYRDFSAPVTINAGQSSVTRAIRVYGDTEPEPTETFEVRLSNPQNVAIGDGTAVVTINDNDNYVPPAGPAVSIADAAITEGDGNGSLTVGLTLSEASATPVTVDLATADGSANDVTDYLAVNSTITFPANVTTASQVITIVGDTVFEPTETFSVGLSNPSAGLTIADGTATVTINDNDPEPPGVPDLSVSDATVGEGDGTATVTITADETSATPVTFDLATSDGTATAGSDYTAVGTSSVTLPANTLSVTQTISILEDTTSEPSETFNVVISNVVGGTIVDGTGVVTITDNDAPACSPWPYVTIQDMTVTESEGQKNVLVTFARSFSMPTNQTTRFYVDTVDGTAVAGDDFIDRQNQLVVIQSGLTKTLAYKILGDTTAEPTESFQLRAENPTRACIDPNNDTGTITIIDNDGPPTPSVSISDASTTETDGPSTVDVTVSLSATSVSPVTVELSTADGSANGGTDYIAQAATTVTIPAGSLTATAPISIVGDDDYEPTETFSVNLANPTNAILGTSAATVTILDDEPAPPAVSVADATTTETDSASTVDVTVSLDQQVASPVTVLLSTADNTATAGGDYVAVSQQLVTIPANTSSVAVPLSIVGDDDYEPTENFNVSITTPTNAIIGDGAATITILDDEDPPPVTPNISVADATTTETDSASTVDVTITLDQPTSNTVTVDLTTADGTATNGADYTDPGTVTVTFAPNDVSETVTIDIAGDTVSESSETFAVNLSNPGNGVIADGSGTVTINDNDAPACTAGPDISISDVTITETEFTQNAIVTFTRSYAQSQSTRFYVETIDETATAGSDYTPKSNQLIVINGSNTTTKTLAFKILGDSVGEPIETFRIRAFNPTRGCIDPNNDFGTVTIVDNDIAFPTVSVADVTTTETDTTSSVGVTISMDQTSINPVTVDVTTADGTATAPTDYINPGPTTVTIPAGSLTGSATIGIVGDDVYEPTETFTVNLTNPLGAFVGTGTATVTINDDEPPPPSVSIAGATTTETDVNSTVDVTVSLDSQTVNPVTVLLTTSDGTAVAVDDYLAVAGQLVTIPANTSSITVPLTIVGDEVFEQTETFTASISAPTNALLGTASATVTIDDDETPPPTISVADASTTEANSNTTVDVVVSLDATTGSEVTVLMSTSDGTAVAGSDYVAAVNEVVTIPANTLSVNVPVAIIGDLVFEQTETFSVFISSPSNALLGDNVATIGIVDDDPAPPGLSIADISTAETDTNFDVDATITLDTPSASVVTVELSTADGTAQAGSDYVAIASQLITIPANTTSVTVPVTIVGDTLFEQTEEFTLTLGNPSNAIIGDGIASVTVTDTDPVVPQISIADVSTTETDAPSTVDVIVTIDQATTSPVTVDLATADDSALAGSDYTATGPTTVTFNPGQTSQVVSIGIIGDTVQEAASESFFVNLSNPVGAVILDGSATVTIIDDDGSIVCGTVPQVTVADLSVVEGDSGITNVQMTYSIPFPDPGGQSVRFRINTENGSATAPTDFTARTNQLVVIPGGATSTTFPIRVNGDTLEEGDESLIVRLSADLRSCVDPADDFGVLTILGDDGPPKPQISIADVNTTETDAPSTVDVTLSLDTQSLTPITVQLDTVDGTATAPTDYTAEVATTVTIPANTSSVTFPLNIAGDTDFELIETFQVALSSPSANAEIAVGSATVTIDDNDVSPDPVLSIAAAPVTEGDVDVTAQVTVTSSQVSASPITVDLTTTGGTATSGTDFIALAGVTATIPAGQLSVTQDITIVGDELDEGPEAFTVTMSNPSAPALILGSDTATVNITDDDGFIEILPQLTVLDVSVEESNGAPPTATKNVVLTFELAAGNIKPAGQVNFMWETIPTGSASQGDTATDDYPYSRSVDPNNPTVDLPVVIPMPEANGPTVVRTRTMQIYGDNLVEDDETFEVHLFNVTSNIEVADGIGVVTIVDNDGPPEISIDDVTANEGENATLTLSLDRTIGQQIDVQVDTADGTATAGSDYTAVVAQIVSFPANTQTVTVDIPVTDDGQFEGVTEDFTVNLSNPVNADILDNQGVVTITDLDGPPLLSIGDVSAVEGDDTFKSTLLNITLDKPSTEEITVRFGTVNGTAIGGTVTPADFQRINGSPTSGPLLTFDPGETTKTVSVKIFGDTEDENDEQFTVQMYAPTNAIFLDDVATVTIIDNDTLAGISIADLTVLEGDGSTPADFVLADATLSLDIANIDPVSVDIVSADGTAIAGTDYEAVALQTVTFPANVTTATVQVKVFSNDVLDGNRDFVLNLSNPVNAGIADAQAIVTIDDNDDLPKVSVSDLTVTEGDTGFTNADVAVTLDSPAATPVTVQLDTTDGTATAGSDYQAVTAQTVTIPAGVTSVIEAIQITGDTALEGDETFTVTLSNQSANVDPGTMTATVTIEDNEVIPDISISPSAIVTEGDTGFVFGVLQVTLSEASNLPVSVDVTTTDGSATGGADYEVIAGQTFTIPAGATTASPPIFVKVLGDVDVEGTEDLTVTLSNAVNGNIVAATGTVTITDDDTAPQISIADNSIIEGDVGTSTLDLTLTTDFPVPQNVTVEVSTTDGTATAGSDYQALNGVVVTFTTGTDTATVSIPIINDTVYEPQSPEDFTVTLANPVNGVILDGTATATIVENDVDPSLPNIRVEDIFVTEGDANQSNVELIFVLEQESVNTIRATATMVDITATSGVGPGDGDYVPIIDLPLVFSPGDRILKRVIKINGDEDYEGNETARILLSPNTTPTTTDDANLIDPEGILTILDSEVGPGDGPQLFVANVTQQEGGNVGFNNMEVTFMLDEPSGAPVLFDVAALDGNTNINDATLAGNDFVDPTTHLVMPFRFAPGEQILKRNFRVNGDTLLEGNEVWRIALQNVQGAVPGGTGEGIMTILDTDLPVGTPTVNVMDIIDGENGDVGTENATIKFFLDRPHDTTVTVDYQPIDGTLTVAEGDYDPNVASPTVTFLPGEQIAEKPVIINRDNVYTGVEYLDVVISNPTGGAVIGDGTGRVTIYDDEQQANLPGIYFTTTDIEEIDAGFTIANLKGYIDKPFNGVVEATFGFVDGTAKQGIDYDWHKNANNQNITTIRFSNGEQVSETKARILSDPYFEGNEVFQMQLLSVDGDAQIVEAFGDIIILDDDKDGDPLEPTFNDADISVSVSADKTTADGGETVTYTVDVTNNGPDDGNAVEATLTLPSGLTLGSVNGCAGTVTGTTCAIGTMINGATSSFDVTATVDLTTSGVVTATATASTMDIDSPIGNNTDTVDLTAVSPYENDVVYISLTSNSSVGGVSYTQADILAYDRATQQWSLFFDGSDIGLTTLDGFNIVDFTPGATIIDFSMTAQRSIGSLGLVDDADVVRFTGTTGTATSGTLSWIIDGTDLGLTTSAENIDVVAAIGAGDYLISTTGNLSGNGLSAQDRDLVLFDPTAIGDPTSGTFSLHVDGSSIDMGSAAEDINGAWVDSGGDIFLSTLGNLVANGFSADFDDIVILTNPATGTFLPYFDGDTTGLGNRNIDGVHIVRG